MLIDTIRLRRSVRKFDTRSVEKEKLGQILEAARLAPSACNIQPWHLVVLEGADQVGSLKNTYTHAWFLAAPIVIVVCVDTSVAWKRNDGKTYAAVDAAIIMDHIILAATELGLGSCWIGAFNEMQARVALKLPTQIEPVALTPLGYPADTPSVKTRKLIEEIVHWGHF